MSPLRIELRFSRPQRNVLTIRRRQHIHKLNFSYTISGWKWNLKGAWLMVKGVRWWNISEGVRSVGVG